MPERWIYAGLAGTVLVAEVAIALFVNDAIIRPYVGDSLAVVLVYLAGRALGLSFGQALGLGAGVAIAVELAQLWGLLDALGLRNNRLARTVLGGKFDGRDFLAYAAGAGAVAVIEAIRWRRRQAARG